MTGKEYADIIAAYIVTNYADRGVKVYREVSIGTSIIGKNRRVDVFVICEPENAAISLECKYQDSQGTVDEKIPYAIDDMNSLRMPGAIVYAGTGFSTGVLHMLQSSESAAYCLPVPPKLTPSASTRELDHILALTFRWWDLLVTGKSPFVVLHDNENEKETSSQSGVTAPPTLTR
jgi:hypothetical protein